MPIGINRETELAARLDMLIEEWTLTAEDLATFARQATERARLMRAEAARLRERMRARKAAPGSQPGDSRPPQG